MSNLYVPKIEMTHIFVCIAEKNLIPKKIISRRSLLLDLGGAPIAVHTQILIYHK